MARPEIPIDWTIVEKLIQAQCPADEIAGYFHMSVDTLYNKVKNYSGLSFSNYASQFYSKGKGNLRTKQYQKAMDGNISMLLKLGEVYLGQGKTEEVKTVPNEESILKDEIIAKLKYENLKLKEENAIRQASDQPGRIQCSDQHMAGGNLIGQDTRQCEEAGQAST